MRGSLHIVSSGILPKYQGQGLGTLMLDAVRSLDLYLVMGSVLMGSVLLLLGNLLADVALTLVDPRIDFSHLETVR